MSQTPLPHAAPPRPTTVPVWVGGIVGGFLGLDSGQVLLGAGAGSALGLAWYARAAARMDADRLGREVVALRAELAGLTQAVGAAAPVDAPSAPATPVAPASTPVAARPAPISVAAPGTASPQQQAPSAAAAFGLPPATTASPPLVRPRADGARPAALTLLDAVLDRARAWLLGGNTVARVGLLLLFLGVAFLLRYVAERTQVPIEWRLAAVALGALALLVTGWRMRARRPGFAVTLQGGAVGILYLTVFAAMRLYDVLPAVPAFALLAALAALCGVLAVVQDTRALAALGATGGYLAPLLVATGAGRVEILLAYYLLLNLGVLGIALFRAWRELNWIGFAFTFGVFGAWAVQRYEPAQYLLAQGFLIVFWLLFLGVAALYTLRQPERSRGLFDTTLTFALPLAAFGIQSQLTEGGWLATAAVVAAAVYLAVAAHFLRRAPAALRLLAESNFAIGVAFLTLAVPLAASAQWTAAAWALEGVALVWVGTRQGRWLPVAAGLLLHAAGAVALLRALAAADVTLDAGLTGLTLNLAVFAAAAFASDWLIRRQGAAAGDTAATQARALAAAPPALQFVGYGWIAALIWQVVTAPWFILAWALGAVALAAHGADRADAWRRPAALVSLLYVAAAVVAAIVTPALVDRAPWGSALALTAAASAVTVAWLTFGADRTARAVSGGLLVMGALAWLAGVQGGAEPAQRAWLDALHLALIAVMAASLVLLRVGAVAQVRVVVRASWFVFAAVIVLGTADLVWAVARGVHPMAWGSFVVWPVAWLLYAQCLRSDGSLQLPLQRPEIAHVAGLWLVTALVAAELALQANRIAGAGWFAAAWGAVPALALWGVLQFKLRWPMRAMPLAYARIAAPGLALFLTLWLLVASVRSAGDAAPLPYLPLLNPLDLATLCALAALARWHLEDPHAEWRHAARAALGVLAFYALNAAALRAVHHLAGVPWELADLLRSQLVQAVLSLLWTAAAMALMVFGHRRTQRMPWMVGAALLGVVVLKLFAVDLAGQGTIERIVSFVGVGALVLLIGYLAPVPPAQAARTSGA